MKVDKYQSGRFQLRAQIIGTLRWECPDCGWVNKDKLHPLHTLVQCGNDSDDPERQSCASKFVVGSVFYRPRTGPKEIPVDIIVPVEAFPVAPLESRLWGSGEPVNQIADTEAPK